MVNTSSVRLFEDCSGGRSKRRNTTSDYYKKCSLADIGDTYGGEMSSKNRRKNMRKNRRNSNCDASNSNNNGGGSGHTNNNSANHCNGRNSRRRRGRRLLYTRYRSDPDPWQGSPPRTPPSSDSEEEEVTSHYSKNSKSMTVASKSGAMANRVASSRTQQTYTSRIPSRSVLKMDARHVPISTMKTRAKPSQPYTKNSSEKQYELPPRAILTRRTNSDGRQTTLMVPLERGKECVMRSRQQMIPLSQQQQPSSQQQSSLSGLEDKHYKSSSSSTSSSKIGSHRLSPPPSLMYPYCEDDRQNENCNNSNLSNNRRKSSKSKKNKRIKTTKNHSKIIKKGNGLTQSQSRHNNSHNQCRKSMTPSETGLAIVAADMDSNRPNSAVSSSGDSSYVDNGMNSGWISAATNLLATAHTHTHGNPETVTIPATTEPNNLVKPVPRPGVAPAPTNPATMQPITPPFHSYQSNASSSISVAPIDTQECFMEESAPEQMQLAAEQLLREAREHSRVSEQIRHTQQRQPQPKIATAKTTAAAQRKFTTAGDIEITPIYTNKFRIDKASSLSEEALLAVGGVESDNLSNRSQISSGSAGDIFYRLNQQTSTATATNERSLHISQFPDAYFLGGVTPVEKLTPLTAPFNIVADFDSPKKALLAGQQQQTMADNKLSDYIDPFVTPIHMLADNNSKNAKTNKNNSSSSSSNSNSVVSSYVGCFSERILREFEQKFEIHSSHTHSHKHRQSINNNNSNSDSISHSNMDMGTDERDLGLSLLDIDTDINGIFFGNQSMSNSNENQMSNDNAQTTSTSQSQSQSGKLSDSLETPSFNAINCESFSNDSIDSENESDLFNLRNLAHEILNEESHSQTQSQLQLQSHHKSKPTINPNQRTINAEQFVSQQPLIAHNVSTAPHRTFAQHCIGIDAMPLSHSQPFANKLTSDRNPDANRTLGGLLMHGLAIAPMLSKQSF